MNKTVKYHKYDFKNKKKSFNNNYIDEENISLKDVKRSKDHKHYRNYENALKAKNVDALLTYEED